jgi:hypothetical protein
MPDLTVIIPPKKSMYFPSLPTHTLSFSGTMQWNRRTWNRIDAYVISLALDSLPTAFLHMFNTTPGIGKDERE